jgi:choline-glycine betaine transporter
MLLTVSIIAAFPLAVILLMIIISFIKELREKTGKEPLNTKG